MALQRNISGFTLIELMVSVGIIGVLVGIAIPAYNGYMTSSAGGVGSNNVAVLRAMQEAYRVENFTYLAGSHNAGDTTSILMTRLHWVPNDKDKYSYTVTAGLSGNIATSLEITATCDLCTSPIVNGN